MRKTKYFFIVLLFCAMILICIKAIIINNNKSKNKDNSNKFALFTLSPSIYPDKNESNQSNDFILTETESPTELPIVSNEPTLEPTVVPTAEPTPLPTPVPTVTPTKKPVVQTPAPVTDAPVTNNSSPVVIPTIYTPNAPGSITYSDNNNYAVIDASNTSQGYVAIKYSGSNNKVKVQISANGNTYNYDLPSDGNYVYYPLQFGSGSYTISVLENLSGTQYIMLLSTDISVSESNSASVFLYPNQYVWFTQNSSIVTKSAEVCAGLTKDIDKISAIFKYVTSNITYDYAKADSVVSGYLPDVDSIIASKKGICFDYAAVFASMCRAQGIPCKLVTGYVAPNSLYHAWNEVYTPEKGWLTTSFSLNKIGYNLVDTTFYANMSNGNEAASYIGNASNYQTLHIY